MVNSLFTLKNTAQRFGFMLIASFCLVTLRLPVLGQETPVLNNESIRRSNGQNQGADYPRQGEYGQDAGKSPAKPAPKEPAKSGAKPPPIRFDRQRELSKWKTEIQTYSYQHYGESEWQLKPTCIVLHYTAGTSFPWNLVDSQSFAGEKPGLASHYVVDGGKIWEVLSPNVRSRATYGINHRAISIEMVAADANDLAARSETLESCARLVAYLSDKFAIPISKIYSHQQVARMDTKIVPEVMDLVNPTPYGKSDPGEGNMKSIKARLSRMR
jgi:N-acetylmuramoyl-L-alanine amidase